jgi:hypothetical protein
MTYLGQQKTAEAFAHPEVGDHFHELYSFRVFVLHVSEDDGPVITMEASAPCTLPDDGKIIIFDSADDYRRRYSYGTIDGYRVMLAGRGKAVSGWLEYHYEPAGSGAAA